MRASGKSSSTSLNPTISSLVPPEMEELMMRYMIYVASLRILLKFTMVPSLPSPRDRIQQSHGYNFTK
ncbi:hypothetical protein VNO77_01363 [Canavalia gladiata]|uniref:Uncharacterized protein n=1 Tax=Canavalia gladiata TaxID=3824 RepID=A0AAN9R678_CANGL